ncbi:DEAD/DEAH box helicase [Bacteriovoracaceae bacterium]|nr:DEAD/DEAH box helicase [Bacteriovoracaceae bacterium]
METTKSFAEFKLSPELIEGLKEIGFENASEIQNMTMTPILDGKDIFAQAETGSGKTGSFAIPIIEILLRKNLLSKENQKERTVQYIVLSPTRELAQQTHKVFNQIGHAFGVRAVCLIGGENIEKQKELLINGTNILVATPGRLVDLVKQKSVSLENCQGVVFDEADRLFDMGFKKDIEFVLSKTPVSRQLIMVSATSNMDVLNTAYKFRSEPLELKLNEDSLLVDNIDHYIAMLSANEKMPLLVNTLKNHEDVYALIFCNTQVQTHIVAHWLTDMGYKAKPISGRLAQNKRTKLMEDFRSKETTILVCTDVAARGLDVKDVNLVINYDIPQDAANYVHRIGRTGRAGKVGKAISFCAHEDCEFLDSIYELIDMKIPKLELTNKDFEAKLTPKPYIDFKTLQVVERPQRESKNDKYKKSDRGNSKNMRDGNKKSYNNDKNEKFDKNQKAEKFAELEPILYRPHFKTEAEKPDTREFVMTSNDQKLVLERALGYFQIEDQSVLKCEVFKKGRPKFFFFGPRKDTYKVTVEPIYKRVLTPYLIEIIKYSRLNLFAKVFFDEPVIKVQFSGSDERLLTRNNNELLTSFEHLIKVYLYKKVRIPSGVKISVRAQNSKNQDKGIIDLVKKMRKKVVDTKKPVMLKPLNPAERRLVHQHLSEDDLVQSKSHGEGRFKKIELSLR